MSEIIFSKGEMRLEGEKPQVSSPLKGVSPLIATVMVIAITLIIATLISSWISALSQEQGKTVSNKTEAITSCAGSGIVIEDVYLETATNISRVTVRNSGRTTETIISAQILSKTGVNGTLNTSLPLSITSGDIKSLVFNTTGAITSCANFSQVRVSTECTSDFYRQSPRNC